MGVAARQSVVAGNCVRIRHRSHDAGFVAARLSTWRGGWVVGSRGSGEAEMSKDAALNGFVVPVRRLESKNLPKVNVCPHAALGAVGPTDKLYLVEHCAWR